MARTMYVHILASRTNRVLYVGVTNNLHRRLREHQQHDDPHSFTARYHVHKLVYAERFDGPLAAIEREKQLKGWRRAKKLALIERQNPGLRDLLPTAP